MPSLTESTSLAQVVNQPAVRRNRPTDRSAAALLIIGLNRSAIGTLVERTTRFTMLLHLPSMPGHGDGPREKNEPCTGRARRRSGARRDRARNRDLAGTAAPFVDLGPGAEMAQHVRLRIDTGLEVYFCDPHSPWQRGTSENTNGLLRQSFPKGTHLGDHGPDDLAAVAAALNGRPRKMLGWRTPAEALDAMLQTVQADVATTG